MSIYTTYTEKPQTIEAAFWDGTLAGAGSILKEFPGLSLTVQGDDLTLRHAGRSISGPTYIFEEDLRINFVSEEKFLARFEPEP